MTKREVKKSIWTNPGHKPGKCPGLGKSSIAPSIGSGLWDANPKPAAERSSRAKVGQQPDSSRLFRARPMPGGAGELWEGKPEVSILDRLRGAQADGERRKARWEGPEHRLLADAGLWALRHHEGADVEAPSRDYLNREVKRLTKAGSVVAPLIGEALGL